MLTKYLPFLHWAKHYNRDQLASDAIAAIIVTIMLIPQSLAYALLAGLPAHVGLYASILPLGLYALFGTSKTLSVGPVAVASLMTASALSSVVAQGSADYLSAATTLAFLSGAFLFLLGCLRLGFLGNFLSHPVVSGFITASAIIIALSQLKHILGITIQGDTLYELADGILKGWSKIKIPTVLLGLAVLIFLVWARKGVAKVLIKWGFPEKRAAILAKISPIIAVIFSIVIVYSFQLESRIALVGDIPSGLPSLSIPIISLDLIQELLMPAILISIIGYVESVSVGKTLAAKRREKIDVNQEFIGLGMANMGSAVSGGFPVTGGFSRSVVNFDAGAVTQAASIYTAIGIGLASIFLTPILYYLPKATLAATIIVAVLSLVDFSILKKTWRYGRSDFYAVLCTIVITLFFGVELGVASGVGISILLILYRTSVPHIAEVGLVEGTEHFRNILHYKVQTQPGLVTLRVDESLYFANASYLEDHINNIIYQRDEVAHMVLMCSAVNEIDISALEILEALNERLGSQGVTLHFSELKEPVMRSLKKTDFFKHLSGKIFLTQYDAFTALSES